MITTEEMRQLEDLSQQNGVSKLQLMENAGKAMYEKIKELNLKDKKFLIVCGHGNNGGDGFVFAKHLKYNNYDVKVLFLGMENKLKREAGFNYLFLLDHDSGIISSDEDLENYDVIVDAMLGTGVQGKIREPFSSMIDKINNAGKKIISVDVPTGLNPDTGQIIDKVVEADRIYTFHDIKPGLMKYKNKVEIVDIGIPEEAINELKA